MIPFCAKHFKTIYNVLPHGDRSTERVLHGPIRPVNKHYKEEKIAPVNAPIQKKVTRPLLLRLCKYSYLRAIIRALKLSAVRVMGRNECLLYAITLMVGYVI